MLQLRDSQTRRRQDSAEGQVKKRPVPPTTKTIEQHKYEALVSNIAKLMHQQTDLYSRQVPDVVEKDNKKGRLLSDVIKALEQEKR